MNMDKNAIVFQLAVIEGALAEIKKIVGDIPVADLKPMGGPPPPPVPPGPPISA